MRFVIKHLYKNFFESAASSPYGKKEKEDKDKAKKQDSKILTYLNNKIQPVKNQILAGSVLYKNREAVRNSGIGARARAILEKEYTKLSRLDKIAIGNALMDKIASEKSWDMSEEDLKLTIYCIARDKKLCDENITYHAKVKAAYNETLNSLDELKREVQQDESSTNEADVHTPSDGNANNAKKESGSSPVTKVKSSNDTKKSEKEDSRKEKKKPPKKEKIEEFNNWLYSGAKTSVGITTKEIFLQELQEKNINIHGKNINNIISMYNTWNTERLNNITELFDIEVLKAHAFDNQNTKDIKGDDLEDKELNVKLLLAGRTMATNNIIKLFNKKLKENKENEFNRKLKNFKKYTKYEIVGEMFCSGKLDLNNPEHLRMLQTYACSFNQGSFLFTSDHVTGEWNEQTFEFLTNIVQSKEFDALTSDPRHAEYKKAIEAFIKKQKPIEHTGKYREQFETFDENSRRNEEYWKDPEAFWRKHTIEGQREFVGIRDNTLGGLWDSYKEGEKDFIQNNMKGFNKKIEDFLTLPKLQKGETPNAETKAKMDQIWNAIPIEQLNSIYEKFASNPEEQKKFEEFLKNNNLPNTNLQDASLKNFVIKKNLSLNPAAEYCYQRLWTCLHEEITGEAGKTLQYLSDKTGDTAFNIKNKVLEFFLPGISIHPENSENGIFYFRDENNLDTLYGFNPEDGKIFQKENISLGEDGIIKFGSDEAEGNLLKQIHGFQDMINFELGDILPDKNASNVDELEKQIAKKIESKINVENVVDTSFVSQALLKKENEKNVCRDRIVGDIKYLLDIDRSELHSGDGEKYKIFRSLVKTFEKIKVENPNDNTPLVTMKDFLDKVYSSASQRSLLKPSNNGENIEERSDDNLPQEGENGSVENQPQEIWKTILLKNLIDPQTQLFDISLITALNQDKEINDFLAKRDFNNVIGKISKRKDLQELDKDTDNQISQLTEKTGEELRGLYEETQLLASIDALEKQGDFLS